jgi:riboflavin kinase/FMN adenylyltransferase
MKVIHGLEDLPHGYPRPIATIGNFDGVHIGHRLLVQNLVARAAMVGGTATVVTFHPHPLQVLAPNNAPRMLQTLKQKIAAVESLGIQLVVVLPFDQEFARISARDFASKIMWQALDLREIYVGPSFAFGHRREGSFNLLREIGVELGFVVNKIPQVQFRGSRVSSTAVRQALMMGQAALARRLLGRPYALEGEIVHGTAIGAGLQVPTANLRTSNELIPRKGVYVTLLNVDREQHRGVTNVGVRPTVSSGGPEATVTIETHLLDFRGDIYGKEVTLEFLIRLRDERRFPDTQALVSQIQKDVRRARRYLRWLDSITLASSPGAGVVP